MATTRAATTHAQHRSPLATSQTPQGLMYGQRQPEHVSESSPALHRYLGNSYLQSLAATESTPQQEAALPPVVEEVLRSPGQPLDLSHRSSMESLFGADFSQVRVHTDPRAAESAQAVQALAYTVGHHVVFGANQYAPSSHNGRRLLAHELAHTIQQRNASGAPPSADPHGIFESSADAAGREVANGRSVSGDLPACGVGLSRAPAPSAEPAFSADKRMRTWRRYARSEAQKDAARIRKSGKLSPEDRQQINAKLAFFEGEAKEIYIREIRPALVAAEEAERRDREGMLAYYTSTRQAALDRLAAEREKRREEIYNIPPGQIQPQWEARREEFLHVASLLDHRLTRQQLYWIWLSYWAERDKAVRQSFAQITHLKPEYRMAAEKAAEDEEALVRLMLRTSVSVNEFLIAAEGRKHLTLGQLNQETLKLAGFHDALVNATGMIAALGMPRGPSNPRLPVLGKQIATAKAPAVESAPGAPVRPPTAPVVEPVSAATGSRIPPFPRRDVTQGRQFPASPAAPAAPAPAPPVTPPIATGHTAEPPAPVTPTPPVAPVRPVTPTRPTLFEALRRWRLATKLSLTIRGAELSDVAPRFGAGGAPGNARPTSAVIVKTTPPLAAPTPTPPPPTQTLPSAPSRSTTTAPTVRTPAPAPSPSDIASGSSIRAAQINRWIAEETAGLSQPGSRPLDPASLRAPALPPEAQAHARQQWEQALFPLAQQPNGGRIGLIDVEGVHFHDVEVSWNGSELRVGYFGIERVTAPSGAGVEVQEALERAAVQVAHRAGAHSVRVFVRTVVNVQWRATLDARGYQPYIREHATGFESVRARLFTISQQTGANRPASTAITQPTPSPAAPTPPGSTLPGSTPPGTTTLKTSTLSGPTRPRTASTVERSTLPRPIPSRTINDSTLSGTAPSHTAVAVQAFTPPGAKRVLNAQDYSVTPLDEGTNLGKLILQHKATGKKSLFKPASGEKEIIGSNAGIVAGDRYRRAPAAAYLAHAAGIPTPAAEMVIWQENGKEVIGSLQEWVTEGEAAAHFYGQSVYRAITRSQAKLDLDAFDYVIANMDRNPGNWKVVLDPQTHAVQKVIPIDMDASLPPGPGRYALGRVYPPYQQPLPPTISRGLYNRLLHMRANRATVERELQAFLQQAEIEGVFTRLNQVLESVQGGHIQVVP